MFTVKDSTGFKSKLADDEAVRMFKPHSEILLVEIESRVAARFS